VYRVTVEDGAEIDLLRQRLHLEPLRTDGTTLYFFEAAGLLDSLRAFGYRPEQADTLEAYRRVVRVQRRGDEKEMLVSGVQLLNREAQYWIVSATLGQIRTLTRLGYRVGPLVGNEPRPREVRIRAPTREDVARIGELQVDIYGVREVDGGFDVFAGAFDGQIDRLRALGYSVERISTVRP
jgi:hypothetical protein